MTLSELVLGIDHPVVAVRNMEDALAKYQRLGFTVAPRGSHVEWGTGNWVIMFEHDYLELRGIINPDKYTHNLGDFLTKREGLMGVALGIADAEACAEALAAAGIPGGSVRKLTRNFELSEGWVQLQFALCFLEPEDAYGLMWVVLCQHLTPWLLRRPEWTAHANGAIGIHSMMGISPDLERAASQQRRLFGEDVVQINDDGVQVRVGGREAFWLTTRERLQQIYPYVERLTTDDEPALAAVRISVRDVNAAEDLFSVRGVECMRTSMGSVCVAPGEACGVVFDFVGPFAGD